MLKWIAKVVIVGSLGIYTVTCLHSASLRQARIHEGQMALKIAAKDFAEYGYVTNVYGGSWRFWRSTNVVTIGATQYQCYAEIGSYLFNDEGTLAITTNQTFIWLDSKRPPKIITKDYHAPIFSPHY